MNANEARAATEAAANITAHPVRKAIDEQIAKAATEGKTSIFHFGVGALGQTIERALTRSLEDDGFKLRYVSDPDPGHPCSRPYTEISW